jgi:hypothetical protein
MTTGDVRAHEDALVRELYGQGESIRQIAKRTEFSRPKVDRILARSARPFGDLPEPDDDDGDELDGIEDMLALWDDDDRAVVPPLFYVGTERHRGQVHARWVDTVGPVNDLQIYRHITHLANDRNDDGDRAAADAIRADMDRQLVAAGWTQVEHYGYHTWEPPRGAG